MFKSKKLNLLWLLASVVLLVVFMQFGWMSHIDGISMVAFGGVMSNNSVRIIDPILTTYVQGYKQQNLVGDNLFPVVPVDASGGKILEFGKEDFKIYAAGRTPGSKTKRIEVGYLGKPYALGNDALEALVPREWLRDAQAVPGIDLAQVAIKKVMNSITLGREVDQAALATNAANYDANHKLTLAGASKWSAATGNPKADLDAAREAIRTTTGQYPNTLVLSAVGFNALRNNPAITQRFQYTSAQSITEAMLAALLDIPEIYVGRAVGSSDAGVFSDVWGNNAILAYVPEAPTHIAEPSYGYTYQLRGNPLVEVPYYDNTVKSWVYGVSCEYAAVSSGITSGFLIQNPA